VKEHKVHEVCPSSGFNWLLFFLAFAFALLLLTFVIYKGKRLNKGKREWTP